MTQPASRTWRQRQLHKLYADLPHAYWRVTGGTPPFTWWAKAAIRQTWLWRDITPGPIAATLLWFPFRIGFYAWVILAGIISFWTVKLDSDRGRTANADRKDQKIKRTFQKACIDCKVGADGSDDPHKIKIPKLLKPPERKPHATVLTIEPIEGTDSWQLQRKVERRMNSVYHSKIAYRPTDDGHATMTVYHYDPLADDPELPMFLGNEDGPKVKPTWDAIPIGVDENGEPLTIRLFEQHLLLPGRTRSGKSTTVDAIGCACLAAPYVDPGFIDPQNASLAVFTHVAPYAGNAQAGLELLEDWHRDMQKRELEMAEAGVSLATPSARWPLRPLFIDELARLLDKTLQGDRFADRFKALLLDILNTGAKCGYPIIATCTNPRAAILTDGLRDQFTTVLCFRTRDQTGSRVAIGDVEQGYEPHKLPASQPGRAILVHDDWHHVRTYRLWDLRCRQVVQTLTSRDAPSEPGPVSTFADGSDAPYRSSEQSRTDVLTTSEPPRRRRGEARGIIVRWMQDNPGPHTVVEIAAGTGLTESTTKRWVLGVDNCTHPIPVQKFPGSRYGLIA